MESSFTLELRRRARLLNSAAAMIDIALSPNPLEIRRIDGIREMSPLPSLTPEQSEEVAIAAAEALSELAAADGAAADDEATEEVAGEEGQEISEPSAPAQNPAEIAAVAPAAEENQAVEETVAPAPKPAKTAGKRKGGKTSTRTPEEKRAAKRASNQRYLEKQRLKKLEAVKAQSTPQRTPNPLLNESPTVRPQHLTALPELQECGNGYYNGDPNEGLGGTSFAKAPKAAQ